MSFPVDPRYPTYASYTNPSRYVANPTVQCCDQGCQASALKAMAVHLVDENRELQKLILKKELDMQPTRSLWCEQGGHPFSEKDPDVQVITITAKDAVGKPVEESRTICGECAAVTKLKLGSVQNAPAQQLAPGDA